MLPLLLTLVFADANQHYLPPINDETYKLCREIETELLLSIERKQLTSDDAHAILSGCYLNPVTTM